MKDGSPQKGTDGRVIFYFSQLFFLYLCETVSKGGGDFTGLVCFWYFGFELCP